MKITANALAISRLFTVREIPAYCFTKMNWPNGPKETDLNLNVTVDKGDATWKGKEGFVPAVCKEVAPSKENAVAVICGPPVMIRFTLPVFFDLGFSKENIITSLEMRMKCGIGITRSAMDCASP